MRIRKQPVVTYGIAPHQTQGGLKLNSKGIATTAGATSLAFAAYLALYHQSVVETASGPQPSERRAAGKVKGNQPADPPSLPESSGELPLRLSPRALPVHHTGFSSGRIAHAVDVSDGAVMPPPPPRDEVTSGADFESGSHFSVGLTPVEDMFREREASSGAGNIPQPSAREPRLVADQGTQLSADSNALVTDTVGKSRLVADTPQFALRVTSAQLEADGSNVGREPNSPNAVLAGSSVSPLARAPRSLPPTALRPIGTDPGRDTAPSVAGFTGVPPVAPPMDIRPGNVPDETPTMASQADESEEPVVSRRQLAAMSRRLEERLEMQKRNRLSNSASQAKVTLGPSIVGQRVPVFSAMGERIGQDVTFQISDNQLVSVELGELISLFEDKLDRPLFVWLKTSANANKFVTPETLARAGIHLSYNEGSGQVILSVVE